MQTNNKEQITIIRWNGMTRKIYYVNQLQQSANFFQRPILRLEFTPFQLKKINKNKTARVYPDIGLVSFEYVYKYIIECSDKEAYIESFQGDNSHTLIYKRKECFFFFFLNEGVSSGSLAL